MSQIFLWSILISSIIMSISSYSWMNIWILMEVNSISFIFFMIQNENFMKKDSPIKYFLIQTIASSILLNMFLLKSNKNISMSLIQLSMMIFIMTIVMSMKMGMSPMQFWIISIAKSMNWMTLLILLTIQKIIPMFMMMNFSKMFTLMVLSILSIIMGTMSQMNNNMSKIILTFSSITHLGWMMMTAKINNKVMWIYLLIYSIINFMIMILMKNLNTNTMINQMSYYYKYYISMLMLSLAGIPPLMGFIPKWSVFYAMISNKTSIWLMMIMIIMSSINFYIYMKFCYNPMMKKNKTMNTKIYKKNFLMFNLFLPMMLINFKK